MEVLSRSSLPSSSLIWQHAPGAWTLTFVTKATFQLDPGQATLAASLEPIGEEDSHWDDDPRRSLYAASDLEPLKPRVDVVLVGSAFAPQGQPVRSLLARLCVGEIDKTIEVHLDRVITPEGARVEGSPFARMSLSYERAAGGPETVNPIGVRADARDAYGRTKLPNLQPPGATTSAPLPPVGFGPVPPTWPQRWSKLGRHAASWAPRWLDAAALPEDLDRGFFNAAPADQQLAELPEDARLVLENLHPQIPRLVTQLPALRPRATLEGRGGHHALRIRCDTLWIDTDRGIATMTFRGQLALEHAEEAGRIVITLDEGPSASIPSPPQPRSTSRTTDFPPPQRPPLDTSPHESAEPAVLPFQRPSTAPFIREEAFRAGGGLPFASAPPQREDRATPLPFVPAPPPQREDRATPLPFVPAAAPWSPPASVLASPAPPPPAPSSSHSSSPGMPTDDSVWSSGMSRFDSTPRPAFESPPRQSIGQMVAAAAQEAPPLPASVASVAGVGASSRASGFTTTAKRDAGLGLGLDPRELLHLLWLKPDAAARICRVPVWRAILDDMEEQRADEAYGSPALAADPAETEDTRDVFDILARGASQDVEQLEAELSAAVRPGGKFVPPLLLLAGELVFPFDERETLRASIAVSTPLAGNDEALKGVIREARDFLAGGDLCPPPIVEGYTTRLREAFSRIRKSLSYDVLETQVERALLEGRHYQKRQVLGMTAIRALLHSSTSPGARPAPVYLPDDLARRLPMYTRFRTRLIAELYLQEDQYEQHPGALRVHAIGRVQAHPGDDKRSQDANRR
jgi:hypothetical protein